MRIPCDQNPLRGICSDIKAQQAQIDSLLNEGAVDLSGLALIDHAHDPPDLSGYALDDHAHDPPDLSDYSLTTHGHQQLAPIMVSATMGGGSWQSTAGQVQTIPNLQTSLNVIFQGIMVWAYVPFYSPTGFADLNLALRLNIDTQSVWLTQHRSTQGNSGAAWSMQGAKAIWVTTGGNKLISLSLYSLTGYVQLNNNVYKQPHFVAQNFGPGI